MLRFLTHRESSWGWPQHQPSGVAVSGSGQDHCPL